MAKRGMQRSRGCMPQALLQQQLGIRLNHMLQEACLCRNCEINIANVTTTKSRTTTVSNHKHRSLAQQQHQLPLQRQRSMWIAFKKQMETVLWHAIPLDLGLIGIQAHATHTHTHTCGIVLVTAWGVGTNVLAFVVLHFGAVFQRPQQQTVHRRTLRNIPTENTGFWIRGNTNNN